MRWSELKVGDVIISQARVDGNEYLDFVVVECGDRHLRWVNLHTGEVTSTTRTSSEIEGWLVILAELK